MVTTGFANLADGSRVIIGREENTPAPDLAPRRKGAKGQKDAGRPARRAHDAGTPASQPPATSQGGPPGGGPAASDKDRGREHQGAAKRSATVS